MPESAATTRLPRRTQEERRAETRAKLLDATIQSLLDFGYEATTTRRIAELAGVSQGAMTHHFPRRVDLIGAAVERLAERRLVELHKLASGFPKGREARMRALLDVLWATFQSETFIVYVKLWIAAADDAELYEHMVPIERSTARATLELARSMAGELIEEPGWEAKMALALAAIRGLALVEQFEPRGRRRRDPWPAARQTLLASLHGRG
jgi:AcrR family transcriptional regulator